MGIMKVKTTSEPVAENEVGAIKGLLLLGVCMAYSAVLFTAFAVVQVVCPRLLLKTSQLIGYSPEGEYRSIFQA